MTTTRDMDLLEKLIVLAHAAGNPKHLAYLQALYRQQVSAGTRAVTRVGPAPRLSRAPKKARSETVTRSVDRTPEPTILNVVLTPSASRVIRGFSIGDAVDETGGHLFGSFSGSTAIVEHAYESKFAERGPHHMVHDLDEMEKHEAVFGHPLIGCWHLHPTSPEPEPSDTDEKGWGKNAGVVGHPWISIILGDNGSPYWPMRAYATKFRGGNPYTVRINLDDEPI